MALAGDEFDGALDAPAPSARSWPLAAWLEAERESWFNWAPVMLAAGIAMYFWLPSEPALLTALLPVPAAMVLKFLLRRGTVSTVLASVLVWFALGVAIAKVRTEWVRAPVLSRQYTNIEVRGFAELVEPKPTKGQRITLRVTRAGSLSPSALPRRVRVRTMASLDGLRPGDPVRIVATLGPPAEPSLPGGFDFGRQAWYLGIGGVGYAMSAAERDLDAGPVPWQMWATAAIEQVRMRIGRAVVTALPGETGGIANALVTGERGGITTATDQVYRDSGLYHVLSISGLHMVVMAGAFFFSVRFVFAAIPGIALRYPIKKWAAIAAALGALGYLLISGSSFATVRSYVQISILFLAMMVERPALALRNVAIAALALLLIWPESLYDAGFQMSFAAVVALISGYEAIRLWQERRGHAAAEHGPVVTAVLFVGGTMLSTLIATAAVAPIAAYHFHTSQQYGALANLVALPVCDLGVMPLLLAALVVMPFGLEAIPLWFAGLGIDAMTWIAGFVAKLPGAVASVPAISLTSILVMLAGGLWLLLWKTRWRLLGAPLALTGLLMAPFLERPDILVGRDGQLVAVRTATGSFSALPAPRALFELSRWLEADGDNRSAKSVASGTGFACDGAGCTILVKGRRVAIAHHAAALVDDCARAAVLVADLPRPRDCSTPRLVVDRAAMRREGVHALYIARDGVRAETVAALRGNRPWTKRLQPGPILSADERQAARLTQFSLQARALSGGTPDMPLDDEESQVTQGFTQDTDGP